jgi:hypothetical protein
LLLPQDHVPYAGLEPRLTEPNPFNQVTGFS